MARGVVIALTHGGGPMPLLQPDDPSHVEIVRSLQTRVPSLLRLGTPDAPRAIILVTAHWSELTPTISNGSKHKLYYDYGGFPPAAYKIQYNAPGEPNVAKEVHEVFAAEGLKPRMDSHRGWDHGVFIPMILANPKADIPVVQVSVLESEDPTKHFAMGKALEKLRDSNIAILGSGFASMHNIPLIFNRTIYNNSFIKRNTEWSKHVTAASTAKDPAERLKRFQGWRNWPGGTEMHPPRGGEHFMPLIVCAGAGGDAGGEYYKDSFMGVGMYSYYWT